MSEALKDAIVALNNGDSATFTDEIRNELMAKAMDKIGVMRYQAAQTIFADEVADEDD